MGRHKKGRGQSGGTHAKDRHMRDRRGNIVDWSQPLPPGLVARPERPKISSKHKSWFEFIENKDKKKKLEIEFTEKREPPPGFEFVPSGNPVLTTKCKDLSREQGAMIFIVTSASGVVSRELSWHLNRVGHHIRQSIVEEARKILGDDQLLNIGPNFGHPEPIPESQKEITEQADAAIRDLFPRIPHTDRQAILDHAFNKAKLLQNKGGAPPVGLAADITLTRRVQLAVLAHIRHTHTRYDELLRETSWVIARKAVESLCLDIIVKWRGDEETGRDQLDEILCEVIVISDSESEDSDDDDDDDGEDDDDEDDDDDDNDDDDESANSSLAGEGIGLVSNPPTRSTAPLTTITNLPRGDDLQRAIHAPQKVKKTPRNDRKAAKWGQRGFGRYKAAFDQAWNQALERQRHGHDQVSARSPLELPHHVRQPSYGTSAQQPIFYETGYRPVQHEPPQRIFPETGSRFQAGTRSQHDEPRNGYGAITGTRSYADTEVVRLSHRDVDLRDHLVPSIEPASPTRYPVQRRQSETPFENSTNNVRMVSYRPTMPTSRAVNVQDPSAYRADEGFIRLNSSGMSIVPPESPTSPFPVSQQTYNTTRVYAPEPAYRDSSRLPTYYDDAATPAYRPVVRSQTRPIWVGEDGRVLRSESRPIIIEDSPDRPPRVGPAYPPSGQHHSTERLGDDSVQIVPVSNKFPRRHGLSPIPVDTGVYNPRPDVSQSRYNENLPYSLRQSSAHPQPQRTERVVGLEYLPIRQNYETRTYLERGPLHETAPIYRSRTASAVTMPYTGPENVAHRYHPDPRRHEVITIID